MHFASCKIVWVEHSVSNVIKSTIGAVEENRRGWLHSYKLETVEGLYRATNSERQLA